MPVSPDSGVEASDRDVLILGAGAAGLSLASALVRYGFPGRRILMLEQVESWSQDRTFCTFASDEELGAVPIAHSWSRWTIRDDRHKVTHYGLEDPRAPRCYRQVDLAGFRSGALESLRDAGVEVRFGVAVDEVAEGPQVDGRRSAVVRSGAQVFPARRVFDSRPVKPGPRSLFQSFTGLRVRVPRALFDPTRVDLMDFRSPNRGLGSFVYVLPYAEDEALVEATTIGSTPVHEEVHEGDVFRYLETHLGVRADECGVLERESSALIMDPEFEEPRGRGPITPIGSRGGAIRPSTGYGFAASRRFAKCFAPLLCNSLEAEAPRHHGPTLRQLDRIFLEYLRRPGVDVAALFVRFADRLNPGNFARFLADVPEPGDLVRTARALPPWPLLSTAMRTMARRRSA